MTNTQDIMNKAIGTKQKTGLKPATIQITGLRVDGKKKKNSDMVVGDLVVLICKHPDKAEPVEFSKVKQLKNDSIKVNSLWVNLDEDGNIQKGSNLGDFIAFCKVTNLTELIGKSVETTLESEAKPYLVIKAY